MMKVRAKNARRFSDYIPYGGFVGESISPGIAITKNGLFLRTFRYAPRDLSFAAESEILDVFKVLNNSFWLFSEGRWALYLDSFHGKDIKSKIAFEVDAPLAARDFDRYHQHSVGDFYTTEHYITFCYNAYSDMGIATMLFSKKEGGGWYT